MALPKPYLFAAVLFTAFSGVLASDDAHVSDVTYGSTIKLEHKPTNFRLHSHEVTYGTGSQQQSVTAHHDLGDANSFWIIKNADKSDPIMSGVVVRCGEKIRLQHLGTRRNLHSHDHQAPLSRDKEVSAYGQVDKTWTDGDSGDDWLVECIGRTEEWQRGADIRLRHAVTGTYLSASSSLRFSDPIPNQLQVSGSTRRNANTIWRTNEGFYLAPQKDTM